MIYFDKKQTLFKFKDIKALASFSFEVCMKENVQFVWKIIDQAANLAIFQSGKAEKKILKLLRANF